MTQSEFGQAYQRGFKSTVRYLLFRGASSDKAEEAAQAAWSKGWERLHQLRDEEMIGSWVNAIAVNEHRRALQVEARYDALHDLCGPVGVNLALIDASRILTLCHPRDRRLFEQQMGGFSTEEIAGKQGVSATAIRVRLLRARRAARASLEGRAVQLRKSGRTQEYAAASYQ